jgi:hypothetical protein
MGERRPRLLRTDPEIDKVTSMITVRLYTIGSYIQEAAESGDAGRCAAAGRARALVDETKDGWPPAGNGERNLDALHDRLDCLEELVPALVSDDRLGAMLEAELTRPTGEDGYVRIGELFDETTTRQLLESLRAGGSEAAGCRPSPRAEAVARLELVAQRRNDLRRHTRTVTREKSRYFGVLSAGLFALVVLLLLASAMAGTGDTTVVEELMLAFLSGALGAVVSGAFQLRDNVERLRELKAFWPTMVIQPLLGGTAGLLALFVLESALVRLPGETGESWAARAAIAFAAGFSQPLFLRFLGRISATDASGR